jgi:hypothetical protein
MAVLAVFMCSMANAAGVMPALSTTDQVSGVVYYGNGTIDYGQGIGTLSITNPAVSSPLTDVNVTMMNGTTAFIGNIGPGSTYTLDYGVDADSTGLPLSLNEALTPTTLSIGTPQQVRLSLQLENTGDVNITGLVYQKGLPSGLSTAWTAYDSGVLSVNNSVTWMPANISPGETVHLVIAFNVTPESSLYFPSANISFDYLSSLSGAAPVFSGGTNTSFEITKAHIDVDTWGVTTSVPDDSEFIIGLDTVSIYRSDVNNSFSMSNIRSWEPGVSLGPGDVWNASLTDNFNEIPVYFLRISYHIPYTLTQVSHMAAMTAPFTVTVPTASPAATASPSYSGPYYPYPYNQASPTPRPTPTPQPYTGPDIIFITPGYNEVIRSNTTWLETSVPPTSGAGSVIYFGSPDNVTWAELGESPVSSNVSVLTWTVPRMNGTYYLKAEHISSLGQVGVAFTQVLVAQQITPIGTTTMLMSNTNWTMIVALLAVLALIIYMAAPLMWGGQVIYDSSALYALSSHNKDWLSKLPRHTIRPDEIIFEIGGVEKIKMMALKDIDEMRRLEKDYALSAYDAMAIQLARETHGTLYTANPEIAEVCKKMDIKASLMEIKLVSVKN